MAEPGFCLLGSFNLSGFLCSILLVCFGSFPAVAIHRKSTSCRIRAIKVLLLSLSLLVWTLDILFLILIGCQFLPASQRCPSFSLLLTVMCCIVTFWPMADLRNNGGTMRRLRKIHTILPLCYNCLQQPAQERAVQACSQKH